ncbi:MAG: hypothetical protein NT080_06830 [Spirochaetes bacterium]|nr:hypothetical protein [Spirochaetota bacterium]
MRWIFPSSSSVASQRVKDATPATAMTTLALSFQPVAPAPAPSIHALARQPKLT